MGKGPSRAIYSEAIDDLAVARQAGSQNEMQRVLRQLVARALVDDIVGQPLAANQGQGQGIVGGAPVGQPLAANAGQADDIKGRGRERSQSR